MQRDTYSSEKYIPHIVNHTDNNNGKQLSSIQMHNLVDIL